MPNLEKFRELGLSDKMIEALRSKGFEEPTPIQALTIPFLLKGTKDVVGQAQTGTGKTGAFGIPLIENVTPGAGFVQALIMAPTRELAVQVTEEISSLSPDHSIKVAAVYGGQPIERQIDRLKRGVDIVVGTPGRIMDHLERKTLNLSKLQYVVLDEADEMLNMGFVEDIETILKSTPKEKRMLLFSATMPDNIMRLAKKYMREFEVVAAKRDAITQNNIQQIYFEVANADKFEALYRIIDVEENFYGVIFCRTKLDADEISNKLTNRGCSAEALHGDVSQGQRERILKKFKDKKSTVLVATDVAARGIDVDNLTHVINYSLPQDPESYVHRIGRTGRAGKSGTAITLITPSEYRKLVSIQKMAKATIQKQTIPNIQTVIDSKRERIKSSITKIVESGDFEDFKEVAKEILANNNAEEAVAAILKHAFKDELNEKSYNKINDIGAYQRNKDFYYDDRGASGYSDGQRGYVDRKGTARLFVAKGKADGMDPAKLASFISKETGVSSSSINDIKVLDTFSFIAVAFEDAEKILKSFQNNSTGRSVVTRAKDKKPGEGGGYNRGAPRTRSWKDKEGGDRRRR
ncbi:MAG: helicase, superfamily [Rickettsiaceae bacterium]|jgi:ATP-dependent RNA helicase DeaD|nr:helicase, superfamily [Rickettsiaceae bacterium]